jgi:excisionase family DNA binding protein
MSEPLPKLYTMDQAADFFGVKECTVRNEIRRGRLGFVPVGSRGIRLTHEHLIQYIEMRKVEARDAFLSQTPDNQPAQQIKTSIPRHQNTSRAVIMQATSVLARDTFARKPKQVIKNKKDAAQYARP